MSQSITMPNTSLHISLPSQLRDYIEDRVAKDGYSNPSDYVRELVRRDQERRAKERLDQLLLEGLQSGEAVEVTPGYLAELRGEVEAIIARKRPKTA